MDWWKLFGGTFILIFLAELGDKTQLAAMAKVADAPDSSMAKWVVFLGASCALVLSTLLAVFGGHLVKMVVPDERYIKIASATLFILFGILILRDALSGGKAEAKAKTAAVVPGGLLPKVALMAAQQFEEAVVSHYQKLADGESDPKRRNLFAALAHEERSHLTHLSEVISSHGELPIVDADPPAPGPLVDAELKGEAMDRDTLAFLIEHEKRQAEFYLWLANKTLVPSLRPVFLHLASEEQGHADKLGQI